jgi:type IV secretory pathway TraG/TraD family ATPase VirD4
MRVLIRIININLLGVISDGLIVCLLSLLCLLIRVILIFSHLFDHYSYLFSHIFYYYYYINQLLFINIQLCKSIRHKCISILIIIQILKKNKLLILNPNRILFKMKKPNIGLKLMNITIHFN